MTHAHESMRSMLRAASCRGWHRTQHDVAAGALNVPVALNVPAAVAVVVTGAVPSSVTLTTLPGGAQPHTVAGTSRCSNISVAKMLGSRKVAGLAARGAASRLAACSTSTDDASISDAELACPYSLSRARAARDSIRRARGPLYAA